MDKKDKLPDDRDELLDTIGRMVDRIERLRARIDQLTEPERVLARVDFGPQQAIVRNIGVELVAAGESGDWAYYINDNGVIISAKGTAETLDEWIKRGGTG